MRIGIKILNFVLATILLTSAALHQEKADVFEFDLVLGVQTEEVGPGDYIECSPVVFQTLQHPVHGTAVLYCLRPCRKTGYGVFRLHKQAAEGRDHSDLQLR